MNSICFLQKYAYWIFHANITIENTWNPDQMQ